MKWVSGGWCPRRSARAVPFASSPRSHAHAAMSRLHLALIALAAAAVAVAADPPRPRLIDFNPWAWLPTNRNRSPSIMDYFFPPSRTPKQSSLDPPADRTPPRTTLTTNETPPPTTIEERSTTLARKIANKTKSTVPATNPTATSPPKTKKHTHKTSATSTTTEVKTTQTAKMETTTRAVTATVTMYRPTKHYTIRPVVRTTETPTVKETETTLNSESTETVADLDTSATTAEDVKDTAVPTLSTVSEPRSTDPGTASTLVESTTQTEPTAEPADSREGYLPLRDKPQQTHVKINEQTKKEVSDFIRLGHCFLNWLQSNSRSFPILLPLYFLKVPVNCIGRT